MWGILYFIFIYFEKCLSVEFVTPDKANQSLQIKTMKGIIQGSEKESVNGIKIFSFLGIPYAKPPLYELRFRNPEPIPSWKEVLNATVYGPCCAGIDIAGATEFKMIPQGQEDCLYLNVYTPKAPSKGKKENPLAVMVFFHGGGFIGGCSSDYGPDFLVEHGIVLVIPNFRISVFGFLGTGDKESPGNWGSKDQIAVLKWVQLNIEKFGGDPKNVTIFGQSAGAANVNTLLLSKRAKGLFHRAIMMSGSSLSFWSYQTDPRHVAFDVGAAVGIETNNSRVLIENLRKVDAEILLQRHTAAIYLNSLQLITNGLPFAQILEPIHKDAVLTDYPYRLFKKGEFNRVPVMLGCTSMEMVMFRKVIRLAKPFMVFFNLSPGSLVRMTRDSRKRTIVALKLMQYFLNTTDVLKANQEDLLQLFGEESFYRPIRKTASFISKYSPVYFYKFSYKGQPGLELLRKYSSEDLTSRDFNGVSHGEDIAYIFKGNKLEVNYSAENLKMEKKMTKIFTNFAKIGNPTPIQDPLLDNVTWPNVTPERIPYMDLGEEFVPILKNYNEKNYEFWLQLYGKYADEPLKIY